MSNYIKKTLITGIAALAIGCSNGGNNNENDIVDAGITDTISCNTNESYNLNTILTNYETGTNIDDAIVRAEWGTKEGKVCPFDSENGFYTCNKVPKNLRLNVSVGELSEDFTDVIDACGSENQTKEYWLGKKDIIDDNDASSSDVYDFDVVDAYSTDANDSGPIDDTSLDINIDTTISDIEVSDSDVSYDTNNSDIEVSDSDVAYDINADSSSDASIDTSIELSCKVLNEFPACFGDNYTTLVGSGSGAFQAAQLGYKNITQNVEDIANADRIIASGNACNLPDYFQQEGLCTNGLVEGQSSVNLVDDKTIEVTGYTFQERNVALEKLINGELNGSSCTITGIDSSTAIVDCQSNE